MFGAIANEVRAALTLGVLLLVASDGRRAALSFPGWSGQNDPPAWVDWLKYQPPQVRLAAFAIPEPNGASIDWWGIRSLAWLPMHQHATLNGGDYALLEGDLRLLGASYERINPAGLRFVSVATMTDMRRFPPDMDRVPTEINRLDSQALVRYFDKEWAEYGVN